MRALSLALAALLLLASHLSSSPGVILAVRIPAALVDRVALPAGQPERPRKNLAEGGDAAASLHAASKKPAGSSSSPSSTVFDPDRMSKRRVRRGSDPIHNKC
jgi:hypothetical protein